MVLAAFWPVLGGLIWFYPVLFDITEFTSNGVPLHIYNSIQHAYKFLLFEIITKEEIGEKRSKSFFVIFL